MTTKLEYLGHDGRVLATEVMEESGGQYNLKIGRGLFGFLDMLGATSVYTAASHIRFVPESQNVRLSGLLGVDVHDGTRTRGLTLFDEPTSVYILDVNDIQNPIQLARFFRPPHKPHALLMPKLGHPAPPRTHEKRVQPSENYRPE